MKFAYLFPNWNLSSLRTGTCLSSSLLYPKHPALFMAYDRLKVCICEVSMNVALISLAYGDYLLCTGVAGIVFSFIQRDLKYVEYLQDYLY